MDSAAPPSKIVSRDELIARREAARAEGRSLVQCHGCFDIVHPGHVRHLQHARSLGDMLLVSITADAEVGKGDGRPLFSEQLRAENLAALDCVDLVYVNHEKTAKDLLARVRPDVFVKGREYETNNDPRFAAERFAVEAGGGRVVFSSGDVVFSSTALVEHLFDRDPSSEHFADPKRTALRRVRQAHEVDAGAVRRLLDRGRAKRVVVFGETIVDTYLTCDRPEIAGESPVLSLRPVDRVSFDGGAAVIARHLARLGAAPSLVTALPRTPAADAFRERMESEGIAVHAIDTEPHPATAGGIAEKQRFLVGEQKVMKLDLTRPVTLDATNRERLLGLAEGATYNADAAVLADYGLGLLTPRILKDLCTQLRPEVPLITGDVSGRRSSLLSMVNADLLCPSETELRESLREYDASLNAVVWDLMRTTGAKAVFTTLAEEGLIAFERLPSADTDQAKWSSRVSGEPIPALNGAPRDVLGCGDALLAAATLALCAGATRTQAAYLGNLAASVHAARFGNDPAERDALLRAAERIDQDTLTTRIVQSPTPARLAS